MPNINQLNELRAKPLEEKIQISTARIIEWYETWGGQVYVSTSGGIDSRVLEDLVCRIYPDVPKVFVDTGLEYPELREFVYKKENIICLKPEMSFVKVLEKYGYPIVSKEVSDTVAGARRGVPSLVQKMQGVDKNGEPNSFRHGMVKWQFLVDAPFNSDDECCNTMKKKPLKKYERETKRHPYIGTMTEEAVQRKSAWLKTGCNAFEAKRPISTPIAFWTKQDILNYVLKHNLDYPSVYGNIIEENGKIKTTGCERTGCVFCGYGAHLDKCPNRFQRLKETHPQLYDYCMRGGKFNEDGLWVPDKGLGMAPVLDYIGVETDYENFTSFEAHT